MITPRKSSAFTLIELLVVISIIGILITIAVPAIGTAMDKARMTETLANAKSLYTATYMMTLESQNSGDGIQWTSEVPTGGGAAVPVGLNKFLTALIDDGYVTQQTMRKLLSAPGVNPPLGTYGADQIAFKIMATTENSPPDQTFLVTKNVSPPTGGMQASALPYGNKGFVFFTKNGGGGIRNRAKDATSPNTFPTSTSGDNPTTYTYTPLQ